MMDPFYLAAIPEPRTILGLKLRPLSVGHIILLNRVESPFFTGGDVSFADLATAVLVCSMSYKDGLALLDDPSLDRFMSKWHDRLTGNKRLLIRLGFKAQTLLNFYDKLKAFSEYLAAHQKRPYYRYDPGDCREMDCPNVQVVKVSLMRDLHIPEAEIMDRSWLLCLWDFVTLKALAGQVTMGGENDIKEAMEVAKQFAERLAKKNGGAHAGS